MHRMHNEPRLKNGPETSGATIHWAGHYDLLTSLFGLGVNRGNSRMVIELADVKSGEAVLDAGCGSGNLTITARSYTGPGGKVYGIDASPEMIEVARKKAARLAPDVQFDLGVIEKLPYPDATFDAVVSRLVIHHLPGDLKQRGFAEFLRVLKPGGRLLVTDFQPPANPLLRHLALAMVGPNMMHTSSAGLPELVALAGFAEVRSGSTRSPFLAFISGRKPAA